MNDLITDVKSLELETLKNLKNSKAHNTLRAYQAAVSYTHLTLPTIDRV